MPRPRIAGLALSGWIAALSALPLVAAAQDITVYSTRDPKLTVPILDGFTREANIQVRYVHFDTDNRLLEQLSQDGDKSRADLIMTADIGSQFDIVRAGHTQAISHSPQCWLRQPAAILLLYDPQRRDNRRCTTIGGILLFPPCDLFFGRIVNTKGFVRFRMMKPTVAQRSISPNTMSSDPRIADTSASMWPRQIWSMA